MLKLFIKNKLNSKEISKKEKMERNDYIHALKDYKNVLASYLFKDGHPVKHYSDLVNYIIDKTKKNNKTTELVTQLKELDRFLSINMAGNKGEKLVLKETNKIERSNIVLSNVILGNDKYRAEFDQIIITRDGIIVVEVKNFSKNFTVLEDGKVVGLSGFKGELNFKDMMERKCNILKSVLKRKIKNSDMPLNIEKVFVFANPNIKYTSKCTSFRHCKLKRLVNMVEHYRSDYYYTDDQMKQISEMIKSATVKEKEYKIHDIKHINDLFVIVRRQIMFRELLNKIKQFFNFSFETKEAKLASF